MTIDTSFLDREAEESSFHDDPSMAVDDSDVAVKWQEAQRSVSRQGRITAPQEDLVEDFDPVEPGEPSDLDPLQELEEWRDLAEMLEAEGLREQAARIDAEAKRDELATRIAQLESELDKRKAAAETAKPATGEADGLDEQKEASRRAAAAHQEIVRQRALAEQRERIARLEAEVLREQAARKVAEAGREKAGIEILELQGALETMRASADKQEDFAKREAELSEQLEAQAMLLSEHVAIADRATTAHRDAETRSQELTQRLSVMQQALAELEATAAEQSALSESEGAKRADAAELRAEEAERRAAEAEANAKAATEKLAQLETDLLGQRSAVATAEKRAGTAEAAASEAARLLDAARESETAAITEADAQRQLAELLKSEVTAEQEGRLAAEARLDEMRERLAEAENATASVSTTVEETEAKLKAHISDLESAAAGLQGDLARKTRELDELRKAGTESSAGKEEDAEALRLAREAEAEARQEARAQQELAEFLKTEVAREQEARLDAEAKLDDARDRLQLAAQAPSGEAEFSPREAELEARLEEAQRRLEKQRTLTEKATKDRSALEAEIKSLRVTSACLKAELKDVHQKLETASEQFDAEAEPSAADTREPVVEELADEVLPATPEELPAEELAAAAVPPVDSEQEDSQSGDSAKPSPVPPRGKGRTPAVEAAPAASTDGAGAEGRRSKRVSAQIKATITGSKIVQAVNCFVTDKSATGAKIELPPDRFNNGHADLLPGDQLTLALLYAAERTIVACEVVWFNGKSCGVKYVGQFRTESIAPKPTLRRGDPPDLKKSGKSVAGRFAKALLSGR